jgi:hypothetical protein
MERAGCCRVDRGLEKRFCGAEHETRRKHAIHGRLGILAVASPSAATPSPEERALSTKAKRTMLRSAPLTF